MPASPLQLKERLNRGPTASFLKCISDFLQLHSIRINTYVSDPVAEVLKLLLNLQSGRQLRKLRVCHHPQLHTESGEFLRGYRVTRSDILDTLCGAQMQDALQRFPSLELLRFSIEENDDEHTVQWWAEQILNRLPVLHDILGMDVRTHSSEGALSLSFLL